MVSDHFFYLEDIYNKKIMNFILNFESVTSGELQQIVVANSWSACLNYAETQGTLLAISNISREVIINNDTTTNCFDVSLLGTSGGAIYNYIVFEENFSDLVTWLNNQTDKTVLSVGESKRTYVSL